MERKTVVGLVAILGIWLTAGIGLPWTTVLKEQNGFTAEQLLLVRGYVTAILVLVMIRRDVLKADKWTLGIGVLTPFASLGLFKGAIEGGVAPTIIVVTATPLLNFAISLLLGKKVHKATVFGLALLLGGIIAARWGAHFNPVGFAWAAFGTVCNALIYECFPRRAHPELLPVCFWGSLGMGTIGLVLGTQHPWTMVTQSPSLVGWLVLFGFWYGFLYWVSNVVAFDNLNKDDASVLAQGETLTTVVVAGLWLGERLTVGQWCGVVVACFGPALLSRWLVKKDALVRPGDSMSPTEG